LIPILKAEGNLSEKRILGFFKHFGIEVSPTYILHAVKFSVF
jgi:hypothetical protein